MKLFVIMAQRKERYLGEHGPEALEVMSEYDNDENGEFLPEMLDKHRNSGHFENVRLITIEVNEDQIMRVLRPADSIIGEVL